MVYLVLSVICAAALVLMFKFFERRQIPVFPAIVVNYFTATIWGVLFLPAKATAFAHIVSAPWLWLALILGTMFITVFNLTGITTKHFGVSATSVAFKLGLVFPVLLAFTLYHENFTWLKLAGIILAFAAVIFSSLDEKGFTAGKGPKSHFYLPIIVFIGSGVCDSFTQYANKKYLGSNDIEAFSLMLFVAATLAGTLALIILLIKRGGGIKLSSVLGGLVLGTFNYFSFLFILKALAVLPWGSSVIFPLNNLGIVAFATVAGMLLFNEKLSKTNMVGLVLSALAITAILLSNN